MTINRVAYLSGKMKGLPSRGYKNFEDAAAHLRDIGILTVSPHEFAGANNEFIGAVHTTDLPRSRLLQFDFSVLLHVDMIVMLPNWTDSKGAKSELIVATEIGLPSYLYSEDTGVGPKINAKDWDVEWTMQVDAGSRYRHHVS